jgi:hypothetical protein
VAYLRNYLFLKGFFCGGTGSTQRNSGFCQIKLRYHYRQIAGRKITTLQAKQGAVWQQK